jgi:hypothetical protein
MTYLLRGALIEYGSDFLGPIPNVVIFQFNPETMTREIQIPDRPTGSGSREVSQAGEIPLEKITITAKFSAADALGENNPLARAVGIGPRLAALEKMVHPVGKISGIIGEAIDQVANAITGNDSSEDSIPVPRESYPRILFIWGLTRVLPVIITSMRIEEKKYDALLNPVEAEVSMGLTVIAIDSCSEDTIAKGAMEYTNLAKDAMAVSNLVETVPQIVEIIPF